MWVVFLDGKSHSQWGQYFDAELVWCDFVNKGLDSEIKWISNSRYDSYLS